MRRKTGNMPINKLWCVFFYYSTPQSYKIRVEIWKTIFDVKIQIYAYVTIHLAMQAISRSRLLTQVIQALGENGRSNFFFSLYNMLFKNKGKDAYFLLPIAT